MSSSEKDSSEEKTSSKVEESKATSEKPESRFPQESQMPVPTQDNPVTNEALSRWEHFRCTGKLPERRSYHTGIGYQNKVYIYGGYDIKEGDMKSMFCLDVTETSPEWQEIKIMGDRPEGISRNSAVLWDDKIYCLGGENNNTQLCKFFYIDISDTRMNFGQMTAKCTEIIHSRYAYCH